MAWNQAADEHEVRRVRPLPDLNIDKVALETPEGWVGLVKLHDYWKFLQDEHGDLEERIFESNVRGFQHSG